MNQLIKIINFVAKNGPVGRNGLNYTNDTAPPLQINPFLPDTKTTFSYGFFTFFYVFLTFLRSEHDCYAKFTSCYT